MSIQVILADDQPLVRAGLRRLIEQTPDIDVAAEAGTGAEAVQLVRDTSPDVIIMDIRMPGMDGIEATQLITASDTRARVLVLTTFDDDDYVYGALRAGASGFLVKDMALEDILTAIRVVAAGDAIIAPGVTRRLIAQFASPSRPDPKPRELAGPRHVQRRDRRHPVHHRGHRQDPRSPAASQTRRQRPGTARHHRLPGRPARHLRRPVARASQDAPCHFPSRRAWHGNGCSTARPSSQPASAYHNGAAERTQPYDTERLTRAVQDTPNKPICALHAEVAENLAGTPNGGSGARSSRLSRHSM